MQVVKWNTKWLTLLWLLACMATVSTATAGDKQNKASEIKQQQKSKNNKMKTVLIIGMNPYTIDYNTSEIPKGLTPEMVEQGTNAMLEKLTGMGYPAEKFFIDNGTTDLSGLIRQLQNNVYGGIVIGNGIRSLTANFLLFEQLINIVHKHAPKSKIIFNTLPTDTDQAVKRWL
jgi:hypothetical protein